MINTTYNPVASKLKNGASSLVANVLCWALSITCIAPVIWMIYSSLKTDKEDTDKIYCHIFPILSLADIELLVNSDSSSFNHC